jgi:mono/diheme cytochrome c family protein
VYRTLNLSVYKWLILALLPLLLQQCKPRDPHAPLSPEDSMKTMEVEEGFELSLVASEPLVVAPVAMVFDQKARIWVAEMEGYMPDSLGNGEDLPVGRITILTDTDDDGRMDQHQVFLDSLVLPRAICLAYGGILVAEPPYLWFYTIENDKPGSKTLVDSAYAVGGNVEHQPNGLLRAMDNWIYSAKSNMRYRRLPEGTWLKEPTTFRGQWGISQDDWGRLYYNDNSSNLSGDHLPPTLGRQYLGMQQVRGYGERVVPDTRVYPLHPTTGVNRGYMDGILDSTGRLLNFTAACGPLVYRGGLMPGNPAFVAEPAGNLIKRNELTFIDLLVSGRQAYEEKEFIRSTDERFRPVNLHDGPDGGLYILDMYRGIIQHKTYLTPYLKEEIAKRDLTLPLGMGRIYRVQPKGTARKTIQIPQTSDALIPLLAHDNGWVRDQAQQALIDGQFAEAIPLLRQRLMDKQADVRERMHILWTLEGLSGLSMSILDTLLEEQNASIQFQIAGILAQWPQQTEAITLLDKYMPRMQELNKVAWTHALAAQDKASAKLRQVLVGSEHTALIDAVVGGFRDQENALLSWAKQQFSADHVVVKRIQKHVDDLQARANQAKQARINAQYKDAVALFQLACVACHGPDGRGVAPIAPPLASSHWVSGPKDRLIALVLYGMSGPVEVGGKSYDRPDISGEMPGLYFNTQLTSEQLAEVLTYIRVSWGNEASEIHADEIERVRKRFGERTQAFTQDELDKVFGKHR